MAKEKKKSAKQIVEQALPKVRVLEPTPAPVTDENVPPPTSGKSIGELRRKYLGESAESAAGPSDVGVSASTSSTASTDLAARRAKFLGAAEPAKLVPDDDVEIVRVESASAVDAPEDGPGARAILVSKSQGKIIGKQG